MPSQEPAADRVSSLSTYERLAGEIIDALKTPMVQGLFELDLSAVHALRQTGVQVSDISMIVAAVGRVLQADPTLHTRVERRRRVVPGAPEIGVSVAGRGALAPVTIVRDAHQKSALAIQSDLRVGAKAARRGEMESMRKSELLRFLPGFIRSWLVRWLLGSPRVRRKLVGTFQISYLGAFEIDAAMTPVAAAPLLMIGRCCDRAVVREGKIEIRPVAYAVIHGDHRMLNGATGDAFIRRLTKLLSQPKELLSDGAGELSSGVRGAATSAANKLSSA